MTAIRFGKRVLLIVTAHAREQYKEAERICAVWRVNVLGHFKLEHLNVC